MKDAMDMTPDEFKTHRANTDRSYKAPARPKIISKVDALDMTAAEFKELREAQATGRVRSDSKILSVE